MVTPCLNVCVKTEENNPILPPEKRRFSGKVGSRDGEGHSVDTGLAQEGPGTAQVAAGGHHGPAQVGEADSRCVQGPRVMIGCAHSEGLMCCHR